MLASFLRTFPSLARHTGLTCLLDRATYPPTPFVGGILGLGYANWGLYQAMVGPDLLRVPAIPVLVGMTYAGAKAFSIRSYHLQIYRFRVQSLRARAEPMSQLEREECESLWDKTLEPTRLAGTCIGFILGSYFGSACSFIYALIAGLSGDASLFSASLFFAMPVSFGFAAACLSPIFFSGLHRFLYHHTFA